MNLQRNIKIYYIYSVLSELLIVGPIVVLFMTAKGLSFTQIMVLQSICAFAVVLFDVPTGVIADKVGRKYSVMMGALFWGIGSLLYVYGNTFAIFALSEIMFSFGIALKSGANTALIYDTLKSLGKESEFAKIEGKASSFTFYVLGFGAILSSFVYKININLPYLISAGFMALSIIASLFFVEPPIEEKQEKEVFSYGKQIIESFKYILGSEKIKAVIFYFMIFYIFYKSSFWFYQPYMQSVNIPVEYFGFIFFAFNIVAGLSSRYCQQIMNKTKPRTLTFISILLIASFVMMGFIHIWVGVAAIFLQQIARGIYKPVTEKYLNKHIPSDKRATILSFQSFAGNITAAIAMPFLGILKDKTDIYVSNITMAVIMLILTGITIIYMNKRLGIKEAENSSLNV